MASPKKGKLTLSQRAQARQEKAEESVQPEKKAKRFPDRTQLTAFLDNATYNQLRMLSAELSIEMGRPVRMQDLLRLGLDMVFARYDKPRIAGSPDDLRNE